MTAMRALTQDSPATQNGAQSEKNGQRFEETGPASDDAALPQRIQQVADIIAEARARRLRDAEAAHSSADGTAEAVR